MQSFNFKQGESLDIVSTTYGLFLLLSRKTQQYSVKNQDAIGEGSLENIQ